MKIDGGELQEKVKMVIKGEKINENAELLKVHK